MINGNGVRKFRLLLLFLWFTIVITRQVSFLFSIHRFGSGLFQGGKGTPNFLDSHGFWVRFGSWKWSTASAAAIGRTIHGRVGTNGWFIDHDSTWFGSTLYGTVFSHSRLL
jgi:hypothetical protein